MTDDAIRLRNVARRPLEIHRGARVEVVGPGAIVTLSKPDPALDRLEREGMLVRLSPEPGPADAAESAVETEAAAAPAPPDTTSPDAASPDATSPDAEAPSHPSDEGDEPDASSERRTPE